VRCGVRGCAGADEAGRRSSGGAAGSGDASRRGRGRRWTGPEKKALALLVMEWSTLEMDGSLKGRWTQCDWGKVAAGMPEGHPRRSAEQCRLQWQNVVNPGIKKGAWDEAEREQLRLCVVLCTGPSGRTAWSRVAECVGTGRTGTACKQQWSRTADGGLKRGAFGEAEAARLRELVGELGEGRWTEVARRLNATQAGEGGGGRRTADMCREAWTRVMRGDIRKGRWDSAESARLREAVAKHGRDWVAVAGEVGSRTPGQCMTRWTRVEVDPEGMGMTPWKKAEVRRLIEAVGLHGRDAWARVATYVGGGRSARACKAHWDEVMGPSKQEKVPAAAHGPRQHPSDPVSHAQEDSSWPPGESEWSFEEVEDLMEAVEEHEGASGAQHWELVSRSLAQAGHGPVPPRTPDECRLQYLAVLIAWSANPEY